MKLVTVLFDKVHVEVHSDLCDELSACVEGPEAHPSLKHFVYVVLLHAVCILYELHVKTLFIYSCFNLTYVSPRCSSLGTVPSSKVEHELLFQISINNLIR